MGGTRSTCSEAMTARRTTMSGSGSTCKPNRLWMARAHAKALCLRSSIHGARHPKVQRTAVPSQRVFARWRQPSVGGQKPSGRTFLSESSNAYVESMLDGSSAGKERPLRDFVGGRGADPDPWRLVGQWSACGRHGGISRCFAAVTC